MDLDQLKFLGCFDAKLQRPRRKHLTGGRAATDRRSCERLFYYIVDTIMAIIEIYTT